MNKTTKTATRTDIFKRHLVHTLRFSFSHLAFFFNNKTEYSPWPGFFSKMHSPKALSLFLPRQHFFIPPAVYFRTTTTDVGANNMLPRRIEQTSSAACFFVSNGKTPITFSSKATPRMPPVLSSANFDKIASEMY